MTADEAIKEMRNGRRRDSSLHLWTDAIEAELKALRADLRAYVLELGGVLRREAASEKVRREVAEEMGLRVESPTIPVRQHVNTTRQLSIWAAKLLEGLEQE